MTKVPVIAQCSVSDSPQTDVTVEKLSRYLERNKNLVFPHRHNFYHFLLFTSGAGQHTIDFDTFEVVPWQIYFMAPGQIHTWRFEGKMEGYVVNFEQDIFKAFLQRPDELAHFSFLSGLVADEVFMIKKEERDSVVQLLERLLKHKQDKAFVAISLLYLFHILEQQREQPVHKGPQIYNHTLLRNFLNLVEEHYKNLRLPKEYANMLYITPNHLNALCKEKLSISAGEIIRNRIILEAKRLLVIQDYAITEIAYDLNFKDNSYFTKFFKKGVGSTPENFRRKHINI